MLTLKDFHLLNAELLKLPPICYSIHSFPELLLRLMLKRMCGGGCNQNQSCNDMRKSANLIALTFLACRFDKLHWLFKSFISVFRRVKFVQLLPLLSLVYIKVEFDFSYLRKCKWMFRNYLSQNKYRLNHSRE